ncbi:MAG: hypothetical protein AAB738_03230 [Patescibacteria group bacterium]
MIIFDILPSGIVTQSGGTRKLTPRRLSRPWQQSKTTPESCSLCTTTEAIISAPPGWRVILNPSTNYQNAILIIPDACSFDLESVCEHWERSPGVVDIALKHMSERDTWLGIQVGGLAGGSVSHAHYHMVEPNNSSSIGVLGAEVFFRRELRRPSRHILSSGQCGAFTGGGRAGQCIILSTGDSLAAHQDMANTIAVILRLYSEKFRSHEGLTPEYQVGVAFANKRIRYATVIPILAQPGFADSMALLEGREMPLGWSHEETGNFLRNK